MSKLVDSGTSSLTMRDLRQVIKRSFSLSEVTVQDQFCHELYRYYSSAEAYVVYPDVLPALHNLKHHNITMGIISDFDERLESIVAEMGISPYIQFIVQSFVEGYSKPSAELYSAAKAHVGENLRSWHVGDDPQKDAFTDTRTIILDRNNTITRTSFPRIRSLDELPPLITI